MLENCKRWCQMTPSLFYWQIKPQCSFKVCSHKKRVLQGPDDTSFANIPGNNLIIHNTCKQGHWIYLTMLCLIDNHMSFQCLQHCQRTCHSQNNLYTHGQIPEPGKLINLLKRYSEKISLKNEGTFLQSLYEVIDTLALGGMSIIKILSRSLWGFVFYYLHPWFSTNKQKPLDFKIQGQKTPPKLSLVSVQTQVASNQCVIPCLKIPGGLFR